MKDMEDQKFDLAKKINEQESMLSSLESEIDELRRESDVLESWDIEEEVGMDRNAYVFHDHSLISDSPCSCFAAWVSSLTRKAQNQTQPSRHLLCGPYDEMWPRRSILIKTN